MHAYMGRYIDICYVTKTHLLGNWARLLEPVRNEHDAIIVLHIIISMLTNSGLHMH